MINTISKYRKSIESNASEIEVSGGHVLVTGATGLIGSCLIDVLLEANRSYGTHFCVYAMGRSKESFSADLGKLKKCIAFPRMLLSL